MQIAPTIRSCSRIFSASSFFAEDEATPVVEKLLRHPADDEERALLVCLCARGGRPRAHPRRASWRGAGCRRDSRSGSSATFRRMSARTTLLVQFYHVEILAGCFYGAMAARVTTSPRASLLRRLLRDEARHIRLHRELLARQLARVGPLGRLKARAFCLLVPVVVLRDRLVPGSPARPDPGRGRTAAAPGRSFTSSAPIAPSCSARAVAPRPARLVVGAARARPRAGPTPLRRPRRAHDPPRRQPASHPDRRQPERASGPRPAPAPRSRRDHAVAQRRSNGWSAALPPTCAIWSPRRRAPARRVRGGRGGRRRRQRPQRARGAEPAETGSRSACSRSDRATTSRHDLGIPRRPSFRADVAHRGRRPPRRRGTGRRDRHPLLLRRLGRPRRGGAGRRAQLRPAALQGAQRRGGVVGAVHLSPAPAAHRAGRADRSRTR